MRVTLVFLLILAGCSQPSAVTTAGGPAYQVDCGGVFSTKLDCNMKATQMCPAGFQPIASPPGQLVFTCSKRAMPATAPIGTIE
jgi:hypothetical protein